MKSDRKRALGFYWVRFEGLPIVAEYTDGASCTWDNATMVNHWHVPGSPDCFRNSEVCELLSKRLPFPKSLTQKPTAGQIEDAAALFERGRKLVEESRP